ncbi:hypothetical protein PINS_up012372 [Pythium insidiosum]|nr:hypothetical protein PINS_up012372 [Pythium insidiosum]
MPSMSSTPPAADVLARCRQLVLAGVDDADAPDRRLLDVPVTALPDAVTASLATQSLQWRQLSDAMRVGVLWAHGYVVPGAVDAKTPSVGPLLPVFTECDGAQGRPMSAIALASADVGAAKCASTVCGDFTQASTGCQPSLSTAIKCAVDVSSAPSPRAVSGPFWSTAGAGAQALPLPQTFRHQLNNGTTGAVSLVSIHLSSASATAAGSCLPAGSDAVLPCLSLDAVGSRKFCRPAVASTELASFYDAIAKAMRAKETASGPTDPPMVVRAGSSTGNNSSGGGVSTGVIIAIVAGAVVVLGALLFWYLRRRSGRSKKDDASQTPYVSSGRDDGGRDVFDPRKKPFHESSTFATNTTASTATTSTSSGGRHDTFASNNTFGMMSFRDTMLTQGGQSVEDYCRESEAIRAFLDEPALQHKFIDADELTTLRVLSKGAFGEVFLGQLETRHVAIKRLLEEKKHQLKCLEQFCAEIQLMCVLEHRSIVSFVGVSLLDGYLPNLCAVVEYMDCGDLSVVLARARGKDKLSWPRQKISIAVDVADAIAYLHTQQPVVVHRDVKSKNVLLNRRGDAKLSDFGVSRKTSNSETMTSGVGTLLWTAPEIIRGDRYSEMADMYSFGVVLSELDTELEPFAHVTSDETGQRLPGMQLVEKVRRREISLQFRDDCPPKLKALALRCASLNPDDRPTATQALHELRDVIALELRAPETQAETTTEAATASANEEDDRRPPPHHQRIQEL